MIVTQYIDGIRHAARELLEESLRADDLTRQIESISLEEDITAYAVSLIKTVPRRSMPAGCYDYAAYIFWLRSMIDADVQISVSADEAEGLRAIAAAQHEFERDHPPCPQCGERQYSSTVMKCHNCRMEFKKRR